MRSRALHPFVCHREPIPSFETGQLTRSSTFPSASTRRSNPVG
jgi:hypothetical protein